MSSTATEAACFWELRLPLLRKQNSCLVVYIFSYHTKNFKAKQQPPSQVFRVEKYQKSR